MSLADKLNKIRSSPKLNNQQQTAIVLSAVEETLHEQDNEFSPAAYFAALLSLLSQYVSQSKGIINKDVASSVVYLLDLVTPEVPAPLLRHKFSQILASLAPALTQAGTEAPLLRSSIGCLESLLVAQDWDGWALPSTQIGPRRAIMGLLTLANDHRPKVRRRAQEALTRILKTSPSSPSLDHPAADLCAEAALKQATKILHETKKNRKPCQAQSPESAMVHVLQLIRSLAAASHGWPAKKLTLLCELLLDMSKSSNEYVTMAAITVFEVLYAGMADEASRAKLSMVQQILLKLQPSQNDVQLIPPWIAVVSKGWETLCQVDPEESFVKLPEHFEVIAKFLLSRSYETRTSASECLAGFLISGIPRSVVTDPKTTKWQTLESLANQARELLSVQYQNAWKEVFKVIGAMFDAFWWHSALFLPSCLDTIGNLRATDSFHGNKEADAVIMKAIQAMGPEKVLEQLPLNLVDQKSGTVGRAWLLPLLRDSVSNTSLAHFKSYFIPIGEAMHARILRHGDAEKTTEIKIFETVLQQIWAVLPGYCDLPRDLSTAFDNTFAEVLCNVLYEMPELRSIICKALELLVRTNQDLTERGDGEDYVVFARLCPTDAQENLKYLSGFASNILAVLFNVYSESSARVKTAVLKTIDAYLGIISTQDLCDTIDRVLKLLQNTLKTNSTLEANNITRDIATQKTGPVLMDLVVVMTVHLPIQKLADLLDLVRFSLNELGDSTIQKKAYKIIGRMSQSDAGRQILAEKASEIFDFIASCKQKVIASDRRDRLAAIRGLVESLDQACLSLVPAIIPEVVMATREKNDRARTAAFELLVAMGEKMSRGGMIKSQPGQKPKNVVASLEEYFKMVTAGLAGLNSSLVSATIIALARITYHFKQSLSDSTVRDLVQTVDMFLSSSNREIVRSALGFIKVAVISLPEEVLIARLRSLIPNLLLWSREHKARFRSKVKHILERMVRRFGYEAVVRNCPESDRKLICNIRKSRDRRRKMISTNDIQADKLTKQTQDSKVTSFENEFDEAVYGSDSDSALESVTNGSNSKYERRKDYNNQTYIVEDEDDPFDLLDEKSLGKIYTRNANELNSSTRKHGAKTDLHGKLLLGVDSDADADVMEFGDDGQLQNGNSRFETNTYKETAKKEDGTELRQQEALKLSNRRQRQTSNIDLKEGGDLNPTKSIPRLFTRNPRKLNSRKSRTKAQEPDIGSGRTYNSGIVKQRRTQLIRR